MFLSFSLFDGGRSEGSDFPLHAVSNTRVHGGSARHDNVVLMCQSALTTMAGHGNIVPSRASKANYEVTCHMLKVSQIHSSLSLSTSVNSLKGLK